MSWSVSAVGRPDAVRKDIRAQFERNNCSEPERSIAHAVGAAIDVALDAEGSETVVKVYASGSLGYKDYTKQTGIYNNISVTVEPIHGFVE